MRAGPQAARTCCSTRSERGTTHSRSYVLTIWGLAESCCVCAVSAAMKLSRVSCCSTACPARPGLKHPPSLSCRCRCSPPAAIEASSTRLVEHLLDDASRSATVLAEATAP
jgi:hypothetical protein